VLRVGDRRRIDGRLARVNPSPSGCGPESAGLAQALLRIPAGGAAIQGLRGEGLITQRNGTVKILDWKGAGAGRGLRPRLPASRAGTGGPLWNGPVSWMEDPRDEHPALRCLRMKRSFHRGQFTGCRSGPTT
jgi:hypothetical protein